MKCMKYGHIAKHCKGDERCNECGEKGHGKEECKVTEACCATCGPKSDCSEKQETCEAYQQALRRLIEGTDYGNWNAAKNPAIECITEFHLVSL
ncbi:hypothetical protein J437_LFUL018520 [Ladona fulva]|uniref:CCHC-type domain-containing protein n=1 Tax=Ladona fulva TaxID=123851 RepID=A0A8K0PCN1_LADFU|nr:hypothetical protein J437_LFUL018520 [Ladona fulva]